MQLETGFCLVRVVQMPISLINLSTSVLRHAQPEVTHSLVLNMEENVGALMSFSRLLQRLPILIATSFARVTSINIAVLVIDWSFTSLLHWCRLQATLSALQRQLQQPEPAPRPPLLPRAEQP